MLPTVRLIHLQYIQDKCIKKPKEFSFVELVKGFCFSVCCNWIGQPVAPLIAGVITPEHFDWYTFQGRAIGIQVDLNCSSIFNGKLLLEGYTKKPMWVDHRANTVSTCFTQRMFHLSTLLFLKSCFSSSKVFNVLTGRVKVTINNREALIAPSQSIMVKSGKNTILHGIIKKFL